MNYRYLLHFALILFLSNCGNNPTAPPSVNGYWSSIGSGWVLDIQDSSRYAFYDLTSIFCLPNRQGPFEELSAALRCSKDSLYLKSVGH